MISLNKIKIIPKNLQVLNISDEEYFSDTYKKYISNSKLKYINPDEGGSPRLYLEDIPFSISDSFYFGSAVHELTLQPNDFFIVDTIDRPTAKMGFMADELYKIFETSVITDKHIIEASDKVGYYKGKMSDKKIADVCEKCSNYWRKRHDFEQSLSINKIPIYLDEKSRERLYGCMKSLNENPEIQDLLYPKDILGNAVSDTYNEYTFLINIDCEFEDGKIIELPLKGKLDNFTVVDDVITLNDLKTTGHFISDFEGKSFFKYHYYRQMAMYLWMLGVYNQFELKIDKPIYKTNMLLVSTIPSHSSSVYTVTSQHINAGVKEFSKLIKLIAYYERYGWDSITPIDL